jgi:RNA polymerase sigma factor FliA
MTPNALVEEYLWLARALSRRTTGAAHDVAADRDDAEQDAMVGLIEASRRYDGRGPFASYAYSRVAGAISDGRRRLDPAPRRARQFTRRWNLEEQRAGRALTWAELGERLEVDHAMLGDLLRQAKPALPLEHAVSTDGYEGGADVRADDVPDDAQVREADRRELREAIDGALLALPTREQFVLRCRFFLSMTHGEIGVILRVTESRVAQLQRAGLERLRKKAAAFT